ncbi:MAG: type IV secretion system DNA-binding domain-containing protein [Parcubacteria group bacterium]
MEEVNFFGKTSFRNREERFGIKVDDRRRHMYLIGKTGMGKTTMMENMVAEDIRNGKGVGLIDPHGQFAEKMLDFVPPERIDDVIYFNPADIDHPIGFNPLEGVEGSFRHLIASGMMGVFKKIWVDAWSARMEYILNNTLLALLEFPNSTLLDVMKMLTDKRFREKITAILEDPVVKNFWLNEFGKYTDRYASEAVAAIQNKVGQFIANPLIRNIIGQPKSSVNMRSVMDDGKILIANLSHGKIGEDNSALLGAMLITKLQQAAMSRIDTSEFERKDFFLYIDEFQNFSTDSFAVILSEARKYRLSLILAHQYIEQLSETVRPAIFGNVGTLIAFRVGAEDAEFLEKEFSPEFMATDLVNTGKHHFYIKLMIDGIASRPFSARNLDFLSHREGENSVKDMIIETSRNKYGMPRAQIEKKIMERWEDNNEKTEERIARRTELPLEKILRPVKPKREVVMDDLRAALDKAMHSDESSSDIKAEKNEINDE